MGNGVMMGMKAAWVVASVVLGLLVAQLLPLEFHGKRVAELVARCCGAGVSLILVEAGERGGCKQHSCPIQVGML